MVAVVCTLVFVIGAVVFYGLFELIARGIGRIKAQRSLGRYRAELRRSREVEPEDIIGWQTNSEE